MPKTKVRGHYRDTKYGRVYIKSHERSTKGKSLSKRVSRQTGEIPIERIEIVRAEGLVGETGDTIIVRDTKESSAFEKASRKLSIMALTAPEEAYHKVDFKIILKDGSVYEGRYDLNRQDFMKSNHLQNHIKPQLLAYAEIRPPAHFTDEQWRQFKRTNEPPLKNRATGWLDAFGWN